MIVTDVRAELGELVECALLGFLGHPIKISNGAPVRLDQIVDKLVHALLGGRREVTVDIDLANRLTNRGLDQRHPLFQRSRSSGVPDSTVP